MTTEDLMKLADTYARCNANYHVENLYGTSGSYTEDCARQQQQARQALLDALEALGREVAELKALSVTSILLDVVPGDGSGLEVYAKSVQDVENTLSKMSEELEDWQLGIRIHPDIKAERDQARAELAAIRAQEPPSNPAMKITVRDKDWTVDYLSLPVGEHELFTKNYVYNASPAASPDVGALVDLSRLDPWVQGLGKAVLAELKTAAKDAGLVAYGWKLVPVEPTLGMLEAEPRGGFEMSVHRRGQVWAAMLAASPKLGGV